ncbi:MAG: hypothetical protein NVS9B12_12830 [Vulcanimicrobiaceae bacterium]
MGSLQREMQAQHGPDAQADHGYRFVSALQGVEELQDPPIPLLPCFGEISCSLQGTVALDVWVANRKPASV